MTAYLSFYPGAKALKIEAPQGCTIADILMDYKSELQYKVFAARKNNRVAALTETVQNGDSIVFLDMRDASGKECYQNSVIAMFLDALKQLMPGQHPVMANSLSSGIYVYFKSFDVLTQKRIDEIERVMRRMSKLDISFDKIPHSDWLVVPSSGYVTNFDIRKYRGGMIIRLPQDVHPAGLDDYKEDKKLYDIFMENRKWNDMMGVHDAGDLNEAVRDGSIRDIIMISEALHEKRIASLAEKIIRSKKRIILIAGPSSSGKTSFAKRLCNQLWAGGEKPIYLGTDDYFKNRDEIPFEADGTQNFEDLDAIDVALFNRDMNKLLAGETVDVPRFDFASGKKVFGERFVTALPGQPIVIEGIHGLNDALTPFIPADTKFKIYISPLSSLRISDTERIPLTDIRKIRRIVRDANKRGWNAKQTIKSWPSVRRGEYKNIFPYSDSADAIFNSSLVYELSVLKKYARPMLEEIHDTDEDYCEAQRLLGMLANFEETEDDSCIVNNSIIREFIGGSIIA